MAMIATAAIGHAFEFDGIELNDNSMKVSSEISKRGYVYDQERDCLKGNCQGTEIYLSFNLNDVNTKGKVGQLIVEIPNTDATAYAHATQMFNVVYHVTAKDSNSSTYAVSKDGTTMTVTKNAKGITLTYNTPYYTKK